MNRSHHFIWGVVAVCLLLSLEANAATHLVSNEADLLDALGRARSGDTILISNGPDGMPRTINLTTTARNSTVDNITIDGTDVPDRVGILAAETPHSFPLIALDGRPIYQVRNIEMNDGKSTVDSEAGGLTVGSIVGGGLRNAAFRRNIVDAGMNAGGGGMHVTGLFVGNLTRDIHFDSNRTSGSGGGLHVGGSFLGSIEADGRDTHFDANHAGMNGGGMYVAENFGSTDKRARIYANYFATTTAGHDGGGLYVGKNFHGDLKEYSFFVHNKAGHDGGGLYVKGDLDGGVHGGRFENNIAGDSDLGGPGATGSGGGIYARSISDGIHSGSYFNDNKANGGSGGAVMVTGSEDGPKDALSAPPSKGIPQRKTAAQSPWARHRNPAHRHTA